MSYCLVFRIVKESRGAYSINMGGKHTLRCNKVTGLRSEKRGLQKYPKKLLGNESSGKLSTIHLLCGGGVRQVLSPSARWSRASSLKANGRAEVGNAKEHTLWRRAAPWPRHPTLPRQAGPHASTPALGCPRPVRACFYDHTSDLTLRRPAARGPRSLCGRPPGHPSPANPPRPGLPRP